MFNMKTSDLFKRAKQLADLEGTNFISWNEAINCINESYVGLYEKLINMGDNSFVSSYHIGIGDGAYELPKDFWQLKGVFLYNNGNLMTINRRADNDGKHHLSYELRNGKLELFGNPADVLVEYYIKPKKLFFKPGTVSIELPEGEFVDCCGHLFLYKTQNESHQDKLSIFDVDGIKSADFVLNPGTKNYITKDYVIAQSSGDVTLYDIASGYSADISGGVPLVVESGDLLIYDAGKIYRPTIINNSAQLTELIDWYDDISAEFIVCESIEKIDEWFALDNGVVSHNGVSLDISAKSIIFADKKCYFLGVQFGFVDEDNGVTYIDSSSGRVIGFVGINENTGFGYATKKFGNYYIEPYCEDSQLNFPNSFYFQIISYMLAIAFRCKQGADISLLTTQLSAIEQTFEETLGSDAFQFPRMGNVYN